MPYTNVAKPTGAIYTNVAKPTGGGVTLKRGMTMGLLIPLTNAVARTVGNSYVKISKPIGASYTNILKPT